MCKLLLECIVLCAGCFSFQAGLYCVEKVDPEICGTAIGRAYVPARGRLRGDFPAYRPGGRAAGKETFWR
jgi:hypothetical protein